MATLREVAAQSGVSITTVSLILNGKGKENHISDATIARVLDTADQLQYRPNQSARHLRINAPRRPRVCFYWPLDIRSNLLGERLVGLQSAMMEQNLDYELIIQSYYNNHIEDFLSPITQGYCDAAIIGAASQQDIATLEQLALSVPIVLLNRDSRKYSTAGVNHSHVGLQAAALIKKRGHTKCALVKNVTKCVGGSIRTQSFLFTCQQLGIEVRPEWIFSAQASISGGAQITEEFCALIERPNVIFYESDCMAQGGLYTLHRMGLSVPDDVEILAIGQQAQETMQFLTPSISCIYVPPNSVKQAISLVAQLLNDPSSEPLHMELEPLVQLRDSFHL